MFPDGDTSISVQVVMGFGECIDGDAKELALLLKALLSYSRSGGLAVLWILQPIRKMLSHNKLVLFPQPAPSLCLRHLASRPTIVMFSPDLSYIRT